MKLKSDIATISEVQFKSGFERGLAQGSRQKALQDASNFKRLGVSVDIISQATGLTQAEVEAIN